MKQLTIAIGLVLLHCIAWSQSWLPFGPPQFCDGEQIISTLDIQESRFAGDCRFGVTATLQGEAALLFSVSIPPRFADLESIYDLVTVKTNGVTTVFDSPLVGTIRATVPSWTTKQPLNVSFHRFRIERNQTGIVFVLQEDSEDWPDNYKQSLKLFAAQ